MYHEDDKAKRKGKEINAFHSGPLLQWRILMTKINQRKQSKKKNLPILGTNSLNIIIRMTMPSLLLPFPAETKPKNKEQAGNPPSSTFCVQPVRPVQPSLKPQAARPCRKEEREVGVGAADAGGGMGTGGFSFP